MSVVPDPGTSKNSKKQDLIQMIPGQFLTQVKGNVIPGSDLANFIKRRLPGEWKTVQSWLKDKRSHDIIWDSVADRTKLIFRKALWMTV